MFEAELHESDDLIKSRGMFLPLHIRPPPPDENNKLPYNHNKNYLNSHVFVTVKFSVKHEYRDFHLNLSAQIR